MAVFIGRGEAGYNKLITDGKMGDDSGQLLVDGYICVYVDTATPAGQSLANQFRMDSGIVISTAGGQTQALRHTGPVSSNELNSYLTKYSHTTNVVSTEYRGSVTSGTTTTGGTVYYTSGTVYYGGCSNGSCGTITPLTTYSTCPNGKCPTGR